MNHWFEIVFNSDLRSAAGGPEGIAFGLLLAFLIGQSIGWMYIRTHNVLSYSQTFAASLVVLPVLVTLMMMLVSGSMAIAFGLLAVFAVVRFRNVLKDTRDTTFILWSIVEGMAVGTGQISTSVIGLLAVGCVVFYLSWTQYGRRHEFDTVAHLRCVAGDVGDVDVADLVRPVLRRHCQKTVLAAMDQDEQRNVDLSFRLLMRDPDRRNELQKELEHVSSVERVALIVRDDESEV